MVKTPKRIPLSVPMTSISAGNFQGGAIDREGNVWTWGGKRFPEDQAPGEDVVGAGGFVSRKIAGLPPVWKLDISGTAYVVTQANEVWRWGVSNINGVRRGSTIPISVPGMTNIVDVSQTSFSTALLGKNGGVWFIGNALNVDDNEFIDEPRPSTQMPPAIAISAGARITAEGEALLFADGRRGRVQRLQIGD
jgi:alpha-tubulin suppressor-like RCC1 family protein